MRTAVTAPALPQTHGLVPLHTQLLGEALVVWKDPKGGWKAFADRCPHRWAPLSEGRVDQETGRLQCIYHGWEFEG